MASRLLIASISALGVFVALPTLAQTASQSPSGVPDPATFIKKWDRSGKGLLDLKAVYNAAIVKFEMLDTGHTGRLTQPQLAAELTPQEFVAANPDGDTTIGAMEWFDLVRQRFDAANPDHDGSLSLDELQTPKGQALLKVVD